jgi:hypothetical protein
VCTVVALVIAAVWIATLWLEAHWVRHDGKGSRTVVIWGGEVFRFSMDQQPPIANFVGEWHFSLEGREARYRWDLRWGALWDNGPSSFEEHLPLWIPFASIGGAGAVLWWVHLRHRRAGPGACPTCGYDRRGLGADAECPECGGAGRG